MQKNKKKKQFVNFKEFEEQIKKQQVIRNRLEEIIKDENVKIEIFKVLEGLKFEIKNGKISDLNGLVGELFERSLFFYIKGYEEGIKWWTEKDN